MHAKGSLINKLRELVLAIGEERFAKSLFDFIAAATSAQHCLIFRFRYDAAPACVVNCGELGERAVAMAQRYARGLYAMDACYPEVLAMQDGDAPLILRAEGPISTVFTAQFIEPFALSDMIGVGIPADGARYYGLLLTTRATRFDDGDARAIAAHAEVVAAAVSRHFAFRYAPAQTAAVNLTTLLGANIDFADVTDREKDMCRGILGGLSSNQIAADLGISVNSVLTYRKRLYQRLSISSQHELFERALRAALQQRARAG